MTETFTRREVAHQARAFGREQGLSNKCLGAGARGRVEADVVFQFLLAQKAKTVRQIAADLGVTVSDKGKISESENIAVTDFVVKNAPKASE